MKKSDLVYLYSWGEFFLEGDVWRRFKMILEDYKIDEEEPTPTTIDHSPYDQRTTPPAADGMSPRLQLAGMIGVKSWNKDDFYDFEFGGERWARRALDSADALIAEDAKREGGK